MVFKDNYSLLPEQVHELKDADGKIVTTIPKQVIGPDAFAIGDIIQQLINKIEQVGRR